MRSDGADTLAPIVGESEPMRRIKGFLPKAGATESTVLICGETGSGKELVAEAVHRLSARRERPLVFINCAALPDGLLESELFGYERGAFTGAYSRSDGLLQRAQGGTVVLDEIGDMTLPMQAKLLRVLETKHVQRLGARVPDRVDVRFLAATNQKLEELVNENRFRRDLYYRLNVVRVDVPPLRERREDVALLVPHLLNLLLPARARPRVDAQAIEALMQYDWPGNVRELRNVLERICVDPPGVIGIDHLPPAMLIARAAAAPSVLGERERLLSALLATNWNKTQAAAQMHWSRMTLYRKLHKYDIHR
jgi:transcriptional regulator with PAS, ATPase and Fis domain